MRHFGLSSSILALMLVASSAMGQVVTATLYGTVLDPQGAIVASALRLRRLFGRDWRKEL